MTTSDRAAVRDYLRAVMGIDGASAAQPKTREHFERSVRRWATRQRVDAATLARFGIPRDVLAAAGADLTKADIVRFHYTRRPFTVSGLSHRCGVPLSTVRRTVRRDAEAGRLELYGRRGSAALWRTVRP